MSSIKKLTLVVMTAVMFTACKQGVKGGSISKDFLGVDTVEVLSPTSVKITWTKLDQYREYEIYGNYQTGPIETVIFDEITIENLQPDTGYMFSVVGIGGSSGKAGADRELSVRTWPRFLGPTGVTKDADDNLILNWSYDHTVEEYQIFYKKWEDPTAANTNNWSTPDVVTQDTEHLFDNLEGSTRYHFVVHAKYRMGEYERPTTVVTGTTASGFPTPTYFLSPLVIGSLPYAVISPVINSMHLATYYTTRAYKQGSPISDPLTGQGTIVFTGITGLSRGPLDNVEIHFNYDSGTVNETLVVDKLNTYIKGQSDKLDLPPIQQPGEGLAKIGKAMATGDFNCDGVKDLAIGVPDISIRSLGVKNSGAGAIYIYYSKTVGGITTLNTSGEPSLEPANPGKDPQVITFDDLASGQQFGYSLASGGNLNGDKMATFPCEDLIVGSPGGGSTSGSTYIFFGGSNGLQAPKHVSDFAVNTETCDGTVEGATCNAVKLTPDHGLWPTSAIGGTFTPAPEYYGNGYGGAEFGYAVSFIGDFNADGYDDVAVGAPGADWDGILDPMAPPPNNYLRDTGYVAIFFGSKYGLGYEYPQATGIPSGSDYAFRWLKIFPPFPQSGMRFGASIAGNADVDGYYRVRWAAGQNYGGSDMVIGAPGFTYSDPTTNALLPMAGGPADVAANISPSSGGWKGPGSYASATNRWGVPQGTSATGAAFLYFGRAFGTTPPAGGDEDVPYRNNFWRCGKRSMTNYTQHYSCLVSSNSYRILFPRNGVSPGFGNSVAMLGPKSYYNINNAPDPNNGIDTNADGYAEVIVAASAGDGTNSNADSGVLWQFFGSKYRIYEATDFYNIQIGGDTSATGEWRDNYPYCDEFGSNDAAHLRNCAPTVLRPNSIAAGSQMGRFGESLDVGDMNGDTLLDLVVGAPYDTTSGTGSGAIYIFTSNPLNGLTANYKKLYDQNGDTYDHIGWSVGVGNFDGDLDVNSRHINDVATGVPDDEVKRFAGGSVKLFYSNGNYLPSVKSIVDVVITDSLGSQQNYGYQYARIVGDINGDGYDDALARTANYDSTGSIVNDMVVYFGSKHGLITSTYCLNNLTQVFKTGMGGASYCYPSISATSGLTNDDIVLPQLITRPNTIAAKNWIRHFHKAGDINGDGFGDIIVTTPNLNGNVEMAGHVIVYYGTRGGLQAVLPPSWAPAVNDPQIATMIFVPAHMTATEYNGGITNSSIHPIQPGDFNGDGYGDIVLGNYGMRSEAMNVGGINQLDAFTTDLGVGGASVGANNGWVCNPAIYDYPRCLAGETVDEHGAVFIIYGSSQGLQTPSLGGTNPPGTDFALTNNTYSINGYDTENAINPKPCTTGSNKVCKGEFLRNPIFLNIDQGYAKLNHQFGSSVVVIDTDKDGFDDLLVSAPGYEDISCYRTGSTRSDYGRVYIFKGSDQGILAAPPTSYYQAYNTAQACPLLDVAGVLGDSSLGTATVNGGTTGTMRAIQPQIGDVAAGTNATTRNFGAKMVAAGDLNGDGYEDLAISTGESISGFDGIGTTYIYYGPLCGVDNDSNLVYALELNLNKQLTFASPALSTVVYGSECFANGAVKPPPQKFYIKDGSANQGWGMTLVGGRKGQTDVNSDGFDDILVGTSTHSLGTNTNLGRGVIFFGGSGGLFSDDFPNTTVVLNAQGKYNPYSLVPKWNGVDFRFFGGNVTAGDTNGDGSIDYMVPSATFDGESPVIGIDLGTFFLFY